MHKFILYPLGGISQARFVDNGCLTFRGKIVKRWIAHRHQRGIGHEFLTRFAPKNSRPRLTRRKRHHYGFRFPTEAKLFASYSPPRNAKPPNFSVRGFCSGVAIGNRTRIESSTSSSVNRYTIATMSPKATPWCVARLSISSRKVYRLVAGGLPPECSFLYFATIRRSTTCPPATAKHSIRT